MNLWLRLIGLLLTSFFKGRADLSDTTRLRLTVWPSDLDLNLHVNNGRYFTMADLGRTDFVVRTGLTQFILKNRARPVVGDAMAKFRKDLKLFQRFTLETRLLGWNEKWFFIEHRFVRHGRVVGTVVMRGLFVGLAGTIKPAEIVDSLGMASERPQLPEWVVQWNGTCEGVAARIREEEAAETCAGRCV